MDHRIVEMLSLKLDCAPSKSLSVVCLGAHPDDIEIGCGGTILRLIKAYPKISIRWVVFSGTAIRSREAAGSARLFLRGADHQHVDQLKARDGFFPHSWGEIKEYFERLKQAVNPDLVFTHYRNDLHQDHRVICELTWNTFRHNTILEYEILKYDGDFGAPNLFVPLDAAVVRRKVTIVTGAFKSQTQKHWFDEETFLAVMRLRGLESGSRYAEAFYSRKSMLAIGQLPLPYPSR